MQAENHDATNKSLERLCYRQGGLYGAWRPGENGRYSVMREQIRQPDTSQINTDDHEQILDDLQHETFVNEVNPANGLTADKTESEKILKEQ
jgi:hypothetical protein